MIQQLKFTQGCPNGCQYCYEPQKQIQFFDINLENISTNTQILDMNFLIHPNYYWIIYSFPKGNHEFVCGLDYRLLDQRFCNLIKEKGFKKVRWAWDYNFSLQTEHQKVWKMFLKAGYKSEELSVFMIVNWKIPFIECIKKLDLLKVWNVKVNDCCYDGGYKLAKPIYWTPEQIKKFRSMCRKHNQLVRFKIDPEVLK